MRIEDWDIVVVTFNSADALRFAWASTSNELRSRVVCVDNGSTDETVKVARQLFPVVIESQNRGLSVANNLGATLGTSTYILYANPDLTPSESDFDTLARHLDAHGGIVSPRLIGEDGEPQDNARGWPVLASQVLNRVRPEHAAAYRWPVSVQEDGPVPWVLGAAVAMRRADSTAVGGWPERYFLYYEDVVLCMKSWDAGLPVWVLSSVTWRHAWARSSRKIWSLGTRRHLRSAVRFFLSNPVFLFRAPPSITRSFVLAANQTSTPLVLSSVDLVVRSDVASKGGGDLVQAQRYQRELQAMGYDIRLVPFSVLYRPSRDTIVHAFNVDRPFEFLYLTKLVDPDRLVVSTIHHSMVAVRRMRRSEMKHGITASVSVAFPEWFREALLFFWRTSKDPVIGILNKLGSIPWLVAAVLRGTRTVGTSLSQCRAVFLLSNRERRDLEEDLKFQGDNYLLTPNGLESSDVDLREWEDRERRIVVVGRIEPRKRQLEVLQIANRLGIALTFIGASNSNRGRYLAEFQDELTRGSSEWLGSLSHADVLNVLGDSRVLLNLSWVEVQSLVDLEGAALGCFVVTTTEGSSGEWLGEVAHEFDPTRTRDALVTAAELCEGEARPPSFAYDHTWRTTCQRIATAYRSVSQ